MTTRGFSPKSAEQREADVYAYGLELASNDKWSADGQVVTVHRDLAGSVWLLCRGGGAPDLEEAVTPEQAARIARTLRLTARGQEEFRRLGLLDVAQGGKVEIASFPGEWTVR